LLHTCREGFLSESSVAVDQPEYTDLQDPELALL